MIMWMYVVVKRLFREVSANSFHSLEFVIVWECRVCNQIIAIIQDFDLPKPDSKVKLFFIGDIETIMA